MASADATRRRNLAKGTTVRQARAALKRALAAGDVAPSEVLAGDSPDHEATAGPMPLEDLVRACGHDPIDLLAAAGALELRRYRTHTLTRDRRREIAEHLENTP